MRTKSSGYPTNRDKAAFARVALRAYATRTGLAEHFPSDHETVISDLLADLMHYCTIHDLSFNDLLSRADRHYSEEWAEEHT